MDYPLDDPQANARLFDPQAYIARRTSRTLSGPAEITCEDPESGITHLTQDTRRVAKILETSIVIAINGTVRGNGTATEHAASAVYAGPTSHWNGKVLYPCCLPQTTQGAELHAMSIALALFGDLLRLGEKLTHLVILTDSPYITNGLSKNVWKWESNDYLTAKKTPVENADHIQLLHTTIEKLEAGGIKVEFWLVDKKYNEAKRLANEALDEEGVRFPEAKKKLRKRPKKKGTGNGSRSGSGEVESGEGATVD
jgi:ribonuclease HI